VNRSSALYRIYGLRKTSDFIVIDTSVLILVINKKAVPSIAEGLERASAVLAPPYPALLYFGNVLNGPIFTFLLRQLQGIAQQLMPSNNGISPTKPHGKCFLKGISAPNLPLENEKTTPVSPDRLISV